VSMIECSSLGRHGVMICVCVLVCVSVGVCVRVSERERETARVCVLRVGV